MSKKPYFSLYLQHKGQFPPPQRLEIISLLIVFLHAQWQHKGEFLESDLMPRRTKRATELRVASGRVYYCAALTFPTHFYYCNTSARSVRSPTCKQTAQRSSIPPPPARSLRSPTAVGEKCLTYVGLPLFRSTTYVRHVS
jgi:hypothetical protein